jgi:hypothetical protein
MARGHLDVLSPLAAFAIQVLDSRIRKSHVPVFVRQVVVEGPITDLVACAIGSSVGIGTAAVTLLQEALVLAFDLVIEDDPLNACLALLEALSGAKVGAIDLGVVNQLPRLIQPAIEPLTHLVAAITPTMGLEDIAPAIAQHHGVRSSAERHGANQTAFA